MGSRLAWRRGSAGDRRDTAAGTAGLFPPPLLSGVLGLDPAGESLIWRRQRRGGAGRERGLRGGGLPGRAGAPQRRAPGGGRPSPRPLLHRRRCRRQPRPATQKPSPSASRTSNSRDQQPHFKGIAAPAQSQLAPGPGRGARGAGPPRGGAGRALKGPSPAGRRPAPPLRAVLAAGARAGRPLRGTRDRRPRVRCVSGRGVPLAVPRWGRRGRRCHRASGGAGARGADSGRRVPACPGPPGRAAPRPRRSFRSAPPAGSTRQLPSLAGARCPPGAAGVAPATWRLSGPKAARSRTPFRGEVVARSAVRPALSVVGLGLGRSVQRRAGPRCARLAALWRGRRPGGGRGRLSF